MSEKKEHPAWGCVGMILLWTVVNALLLALYWSVSSTLHNADRIQALEDAIGASNDG